MARHGEARHGTARRGAVRQGKGANGPSFSLNQGASMFEEKGYIRRIVNELVRVTSNLERGDVITHEAIERVSGVNRYTGPWNQIVRRFRRRVLKERGIAMLPVVQVGYHFCTQQEQLTVCAENRQRRAIRQVTRGCQEVGALPLEGLTDHQQRLKKFTMDAMKAERKAMKHALKDQSLVNRKSEVNPQRPRPTTIPQD